MKSLFEYIYKADDIRTNDYLFEDFCLDNDIDASKLSEDELIEIYDEFELRKFVKPLYGMTNKFFSYEEYQDHIYNSIIYEDLQNFKKELSQNFGITNFEITNELNKYICTLKVKKNFNYKSDDFIKLCKKYNVFVSFVTNGIIRNSINIEDNETLDCSDKVYNESKGILYHLTTPDRIDKILKYGLEPRSENEKFNYPNRIYFISNISSNKNLTHIKNVLEKNDYVLLRIDLNKINNRIKFFLDPRTDENITSYWTSEPIPPFCLKKIDKIGIGDIMKHKFVSFTTKLHNAISKRTIS